jgi:hypothetical protein
MIHVPHIVQPIICHAGTAYFTTSYLMTLPGTIQMHNTMKQKRTETEAQQQLESTSEEKTSKRKKAKHKRTVPGTARRISRRRGYLEG